MVNDHIFRKHESEVRSYCRSFPAVFAKGRGHLVYDEGGRCYTDFLMGAGALNYGHNHPRLKRALLDYLEGDGITHSLDLYTKAKRSFLEAFDRVILGPRELDYKVQFTGPTGTNAIEAAQKLARKVTGRSQIVAFTNGFHGMTLGALAATANRAKRNGANVPLSYITRMPYDGYLGAAVDTIDQLETMLDDPGSGIDLPAAFLVETVQGEGGLNVASSPWLRRLQGLAERIGAFLIVDDIQTGCGRTGTFFGFEEAGLYPDVVCLSKSISGMGLPMALVLIKPELDRWDSGEHNGTFRGNNLAFVAAVAALEFWADPAFEPAIARRATIMDQRLEAIAERYRGAGVEPKGKGMMRGLCFHDPALATTVSQEAFRIGLIAETCGARDEVLKLLPPLTIGEADLRDAFDILEAALAAVVDDRRVSAAE